jgi:hypothetical protein
MSNTIPSTNISIKDDLHIKWTDANGHELIGVSETSGPYKMSDLRGALFTDGSTIASTGPIKMSDIKGKHFAQKFNTDGYKVFSTNSPYNTHLYGTTDSFGTSNRRAKLASGQSGSYPYSIMLVTPHGRGSNDSPGLVVDRTSSDAVDEATLWFKAVNHNGYNQVQMGIIKKDNALTWTQQLAYLHNKHATYADRMGFHGLGYHNYAGSRDDLKSSSSIVTPAYIQNSGNNGTYGSKLTSNFHNIIGKTAGTMRSEYSSILSDAGGTGYWFFTNSFENYTSYRATTLLSNHGLKIKWYTATLDVKFTSGSSEIVPQSGTWTQSDLNNIFSGMYISDTTNVSLTNGVFIGKVYTDSITMYQETGVSSLTEITASTSGSETITISGYLYWTLATTATYSNPVILGPPHAVLPRFHADSAGGTPSSITEWAFYIGDTTSASTNTFEYDINGTEPSGNTFSYSVTYGLKPEPIPATYEFAINVGGTYIISGSLSSITPSSSGYPFTTQISSSAAWSQYSMGARIQFMVSGQVVALGVQNRYGGNISIFPDGSNTAAAGPVSVAGNGSTSTTRNYRYTTLSSPLSVVANSIYRIGFTNTGNYYSYHNISTYDGTLTSSGNIKLLSGAYIYAGNHTTPVRPTTLNTTYNYGSTDLIFIAD